MSKKKKKNEGIIETDYLLFLDELKNNNKVNQERNKDYSYNRYFLLIVQKG